MIKVISNFKNQYIIKGTKFESLQSYNSIIIFKYKGRVYLDEYYWNYSKTTGKHRNDFLNENIKTTRLKIISGIYKLKNLNK